MENILPANWPMCSRKLQFGSMVAGAQVHGVVKICWVYLLLIAS